MSLNGGLGSVIQKNTVLLNDSLVEGRITSCKHANGRDWWVIVPHFMTGIFHTFLITPQGIQGPYQKNLITHRDNSFGQALFSPQGNKFAYYEPYGDLDIWDFDRCTGDFTNQVHIDINDSAAGGGAAFSLSGNYLYLSSHNYVYQFNTQVSNIDSSRITVGVYDGFTSYGLSANFYLSALAPDGKIYINCGNSTTVIHKIEYPDSAGLACGFCQHCVLLPGANAFTIPNFPNYFLGAEGGTVCDSLLTSVSSIIQPKKNYSLYPNPTTGLFTLSFQGLSPSLFKLIDFTGRVCLTSKLDPQSVSFSGSISALENGIYYYQVLDTYGNVETAGKLILEK